MYRIEMLLFLRPRNRWPLARVVKVYISEDGSVRKAQKADGELAK